MSNETSWGLFKERKSTLLSKLENDETEAKSEKFGATRKSAEKGKGRVTKENEGKDKTAELETRLKNHETAGYT
jgi:hypothetical protein